MNRADLSIFERAFLPGPRATLALLLLATVVGCGDTARRPDILNGLVCERPPQYAEATPLDRFDSRIERYEADDLEDPPAPGPIVFIGSSSIAAWGTLPEDMAPLHVLNRGFGGSVMTQATAYIDRIVLPYEPTAVVLYEGDNDTAFGLSGACVLEDYEAFIGRVHDARPDTPIYFLSIKPSVARQDIWPDVAEVNAIIEARTTLDDRLHYVDMATSLLDANGLARPELFISDGLHLNADGYAIWRDALRPTLLDAFGDG